ARRAPGTPVCRAGAGSRMRRRQPPERIAGDLAVVERDRAVGEFLSLLVPLAGDQDDVTVTGDSNRALDRGGPVRLDFDFAGDSTEHLVDDRLRVLAAWVV